MKNNKFPGFSIWKSFFLFTILIFFVSVFAFYIETSSSLNGHSNPYTHIFLRLIRFLFILGAAVFVRKKNQEALIQQKPLQNKRRLILAILFIVSILLYINNTFRSIYWTLTATFGMADLDKTPLWLAVLWEQLLTGDFYWSLLFGSTVIFF